MAEAEYRAAAERLGVEIAAVKAVAEVEASGQTMWTIAGRPRLPIRLEAHWFDRLIGYRFNESHPHLSRQQWTPSVAARGRLEAWAQFDEASALDESAAIQARSWGLFQIMGFHWKALGFASPQDEGSRLHRSRAGRSLRPAHPRQPAPESRRTTSPRSCGMS